MKFLACQETTLDLILLKYESMCPCMQMSFQGLSFSENGVTRNLTWGELSKILSTKKGS